MPGTTQDNVVRSAAGQANKFKRTPIQGIDSHHDLSSLLEAVRRDPPSSEACDSLADRLMGLGYAAQAALWRRWALLPPELKHLEESIADLRQRLQLDPAASASSGLSGRSGHPLDPELALRQAQVLLEQEDLTGARRLLSRVASQMGLPPALCNRVGMLEEQAGEYWRAEWWYRTSLQQVPSQHMVWFPLAKVLLWQEAWDEALSAAEQGLRLSPGHPWGLKLRLQALRAVGAVFTLSKLAALGGLPSGENGAHFAAAEADRQRRLRNLASRPTPPDLPMVEKIRLRTLLGQRPPRWAILHGRSAGPLAMARDAELLPNELEIHPIASRDPLALRACLSEYRLDLRAEEPLSSLPSLPRLGLVVIHRSMRRSLPRALSQLMRDGVPLLAPAGWVQPSSDHNRLLVHSGWELWWPNDLARN